MNDRFLERLIKMATLLVLIGHLVTPILTLTVTILKDHRCGYPARSAAAHWRLPAKSAAPHFSSLPVTATKLGVPSRTTRNSNGVFAEGLLTDARSAVCSKCFVPA
jgi:hypothetical protein